MGEQFIGGLDVIEVETVRDQWRNAGGTLSSLGVYSADLSIPLGPYAAGLGDYRIVTTLCPGGKERMRRLMAVVASGRVDVRG